METSPRLRRYAKKEYSQTVAFPVEIVGRDNLVRRYSFDDAVRLYQRRIQTAPMRYADSATVDAEIRHCHLRIDQLRRSYLETIGLAWLPDATASGLLKSPLAADVTAFLRRLLGETSTSAAALDLVPLESTEAEVFWVRGGPIPAGSMLYAYRLDGEGAPRVRAALEADLARLRSAENDPGAERLFVGLVGPDLALLLAGTQPWSGPSGLLHAIAEDAAAEGDAWRDGMAALHDGQVGSALSRLEAGLDSHPDRVLLARSTALVAMLAAEPERAEFAARTGLLSSPDDPLLVYVLSLALFAQKRPADARQALLPSRSAGAAVLLAVDAIARGSCWEAYRRLAVAERGGEGEWYALRAKRSATQALYTVLAVRSAAGVFVVAAAAMCTFASLASAPTMGVWPAAGGFGIVGALLLGWEWHLRGVVRQDLVAGRVGKVRCCVPEMLPREVDVSPKQ